jgi:predicted nucleotidyltransferase
MRRPSLDSVVVKSVDVGAVRAAADRYAADILARRADVEEIVVFGSFENGTWAPGSDLDVLIVLAAADLPVRDRIPTLLPERFPVPVDLFPFTRDELRARSDSPLMAAVAASHWRYRRSPDRWSLSPDPSSH